MIDLYRINLNLLIALDALIKEKNVTHAANKLFLTQSAMSNNLQQLREIFNDELLIRDKKRMLLTSKAKSLQLKLQLALTHLNNILSKEPTFDPKKSNRVFKIAIPDYMTVTTLPKILKSLQAYAPNIKIYIKTIGYIDSASHFENNEFDLAIGVLTATDDVLCSELICKDELMCIMNKKHVLAKKEKITLSEFLSHKHIGSYVHQRHPVDIILSTLGKKRDIHYYCTLFAAKLSAIEESKTLLTTASKSLIKATKKNYKFTAKQLPLKIPDVLFHLVWHKIHDNDEGNKWLRNLIIQASKGIT